MTAPKLTTTDAIETFGEQLYTRLPPPSPQAAERVAQILSAALQAENASGEEKKPAA